MADDIQPLSVHGRYPGEDADAAEGLSEVVGFLRGAGGDPRRARTVRTHAAVVVLTGDAAFKVKRPVRYDYLDFSTLGRRRAALEREVSLNAPHAPGIYGDVVALTRGADGALHFGGPPPVVEWVLRMRRFRSEDELSAIARRRGVDGDLAEALGRMVHRYHDHAPPRPEDGRILIGEILDELDAAYARMSDVLPAEEARAFMHAARSRLSRCGEMLAARGADGHVRRCHGDLHLGNIVLVDGAPVPFDALEFDERLGTCDVLYDLAFLLMDLWARGAHAAANRVLNAYLEAEPDPEALSGLAALPLFVAVRAGIRAMVDIQAARTGVAPGESVAEGRRYLHLACEALAPASPGLVAVGGLSGTGKTSLARRLAPCLPPVPGAVHLRADMARKRHFRVPPETRLPDSAYSAAMGEIVQDALRRRAGIALDAGYAAILDTTFLDPDTREAAEALAAGARAPFAGLWLDAPQDVLQARVSDRTGDASDADASVVARQGQRDPGAVSWPSIDADRPLDDLADAALGAVEAQGLSLFDDQSKGPFR